MNLLHLFTRCSAQVRYRQSKDSKEQRKELDLRTMRNQMYIADTTMIRVYLDMAARSCRHASMISRAVYAPPIPSSL
jgi:hypothetical protein